MHSKNVFQYSKIRTRKRNAKKSIKTEKKNCNPALSGIRNPLGWNLESSSWNPESTAWNPESNTVMDSLTWGDTFHVTLKINFQRSQTTATLKVVETLILHNN